MTLKDLHCCAAFCLWNLAVVAEAQPGLEIKAKPPLYSYAADWTVARNQSPDWDKVVVETRKLFEKNLASGTLTGFGDYQYLVHTPDGFTRGTWWGASSMAGVTAVDFFSCPSTLQQPQPMRLIAFDAMTYGSKHRDALLLTNSTLK